jgi:uncharacterized integral membrane protein
MFVIVVDNPDPRRSRSKSPASAQSADDVHKTEPIATPRSSEPTATETQTHQRRRHARRYRLQLYSGLGVLLFIYVVALIVLNTDRVKVNWVFGTGRVSLVWLVVLAAVLGWLIGVLLTVLFHRRTRGPRPRK